jgi:hypothetical protein
VEWVEQERITPPPVPLPRNPANTGHSPISSSYRIARHATPSNGIDRSQQAKAGAEGVLAALSHIQPEELQHVVDEIEAEVNTKTVPSHIKSSHGCTPEPINQPPTHPPTPSSTAATTTSTTTTTTTTTTTITTTTGGVPGEAAAARLRAPRPLAAQRIPRRAHAHPQGRPADVPQGI